MNLRNAALCPIALGLLVGTGLTAQSSLQLHFENHNGESSPIESIQALQTGDLVGTAVVAEQAPDAVFVRWAYYLNGGILDESREELSYIHPIAVANTGPASQSGGEYEIRLPLGHSDGHVFGTLLPIGQLEVRVWLTAGYEPRESNPPAAPLATFSQTLQTVAPTAAVYVPSAYELEPGTSVQAWILVDTPPQRDTYYAIRGAGGVTPRQTTVVVQARKTCSQPFWVQLGEDPGTGGLTATNMTTGEVHRSGAMRSTYATQQPGEGPANEYLQENRYCKSHTKPETGGDTQVCGKCSVAGGTPELPPICAVYNGVEGAETASCVKYVCGIYPSYKCKIVRVTLPLKHWKLAGPYRTEQCLDVVITDDSTVEGKLKLAKILELGGSVGSTVVYSGKSTKRCCDREYSGTRNVDTADCETVTPAGE